jgi:sortase (surface protein transpeptidase)
LGSLFVLAGIGYLIYAEIARSRLGYLVYEVSPVEREGWVTAPLPATGSLDSLMPGDGLQDPTVDGVTSGSVISEPIEAAQLFPARWTNPRYWSAPEWAGSLPYGSADLPDGFVYLNSAEIIRDPDDFPTAETLEIPAIKLSTSVYGLAVNDEGGKQLWESPVDIVGHIPETAHPGEVGAGWYFGHLESPVRGEGNVFHDLPDVVELIKHDPVDIIIGSSEGEFLYRVTKTGFIHRDDLVLDQTSDSTVTLVSSYPKLVYDHRLLVTGELLAFRPPG